MFNSGSDKRTSSLASGSFHCWLHPRCVHICPPGHYVLRWKNKQTTPTGPGTWPTDSRLAVGVQAGKKNKAEGSTHLTYPFCPLCLGGLYPFPLPRVLTARLRAALAVVQFSDTVLDGLKTAATGRYLHSISTEERLEEQRERERASTREEVIQARTFLFFLLSFLFFFLLLFISLHGSQSP